MSGSAVRPSPEFCIECYTYGVVSSGAVLIIGPPGSGKTTLARSFIRLALQNGQPLLVLSTQTSAADLQVTAEKMRQKFGGTASVVDCYAQSTGNSGPSSSGMLDLTEIGKMIRQNLGGQVRPFIIFDSLDGVVLNAGEGGTLQFLLKCLHDLEGSKATGVATATTGIHSSKFENMVRTYFRGVLELKIEEKEGRLQRYVRIHSLKGTSHHTEWYDFSITDEGIVLGSNSYRSNLPPRHSELHFLRFASDYKEPPEIVDLPKLTWDDLGGSEEIKQVLKESVELPLATPDEYEKLGVRPPRGILFYGPPGTGKSHIARVLASVVNANMVSLKGAELLGSDAPERRLSELFSWAKSNSPTIIFFDEIDSLATKRSLTNPSDRSYRIVTQLLSEMSDIEAGKNVIVIATTNHPELIDDAMLRPGRFDRRVYVPPPDPKARKKILERMTSGRPLADDVNLDRLALATEGYSTADLAALCNEAAAKLLKARLEGKPNAQLTQREFQSAMRFVRPAITPEILRHYEEYRSRTTVRVRPPEEQRKLAGIMFTDLVGFTSLAQEDEKSALRALEDHKKLLRPVFTAYNGREVKTIGDAFLVEFESALDATRCAISIQGKLRAYNARHSRAKRIDVRIGVHVGDVIHKGNDIYGDAVNIASRVAPLSPPAGICITQQVFDQVHNKVKNRIVKLGPTTLKNVKSKVPVYTVAL